MTECAHCENERERQRKVGAYWLTPEGRAAIRATWDDPEDGAIPLTLLNALEASEKRESELDRIVGLAINVCEARAEGLPIEKRLDKLHEALVRKYTLGESVASHAPSAAQPPPPHTCVHCDRPIDDGAMMGAGDGAGQRFAHVTCWHAIDRLRAAAPPQPDLDSTPFTPTELTDLAARGYKRVNRNAPPKARLDADGTAEPLTKLVAHVPAGERIVGHSKVIDYELRDNVPPPEPAAPEHCRDGWRGCCTRTRGECVCSCAKCVVARAQPIIDHIDAPSAAPQKPIAVDPTYLESLRKTAEETKDWPDWKKAGVVLNPQNYETSAPAPEKPAAEVKCRTCEAGLDCDRDHYQPAPDETLTAEEWKELSELVTGIAHAYPAYIRIALRVNTLAEKARR